MLLHDGIRGDGTQLSLAEDGRQAPPGGRGAWNSAASAISTFSSRARVSRVRNIRGIMLSHSDLDKGMDDPEADAVAEGAPGDGKVEALIGSSECTDIGARDLLRGLGPSNLSPVE